MINRICHILFLLWLLSVSAYAQLPFITTWKTDNPGVSGNNSITIPVDNSRTYDYDVDWNNDGVFDQFNITGSVTHNFGVAGTYTIRIRGTFPAIFFDQGGDGAKLLDVSQWGGITWQSFSSAFSGCVNLNISATDAPDLSGVQSLSKIFTGCTDLNADINHWNVGNIINMQMAFQNCTSFNQPLDNWDVSKVESFWYTFANASSFDQDIGNWDVRQVRNMDLMFDGATAFNQDISSWQTDNLRQMGYMFRDAANFNQPIGNWNVSQVTRFDGIFRKAQAFNQNLSNWDVSNATSMVALFSGATAFNQDLSTWNVSKVTDFSHTFYGATAFNGDITNWNTGSAETTSRMFFGASSFNRDISGWNVANVTSMEGMFSSATVFNQDIGSWNVAKVTDMAGMFNGADAFNIDISSWNTGMVGNMSFMFANTQLFNQPIGSWNVSNVTNMRFMFSFAEAFNQDLSNWNVERVKNMAGMFNSSLVFNGDITTWQTDSVTDMQSMFFASAAFNQPIGNWNVSSVTNMFRLFRQAGSFNQDISGWDVSGVTNMSQMMYGLSDFNYDIGDWDVSKVTDMSSMLFAALSFNQNLGRWDVSKVENASSMLQNVPLSIENYDSLLIGWSTRNLQSNVIFDANKGIYCTGREERDSILTKFNWTITDAGPEAIAPTAVCKDTTLYIPYATAFIVLDAAEIGVNSFDNCAPLTYSLSQTAFSCADVGSVVNATLTVDDGNGNQDFCISNITVLDTISSLFVTCPADISLPANTPNCSRKVFWDEPQVSCGAVNVVSNFTSGDTFAVGTNLIEYTATDAFGDSESCTFSVEVTSDLTVNIDSTHSPTCSDISDGQAFATVTGGQLPYAFDWDNDGTGDNDDVQNANLPSGDFTLEVIDDIGCVASDMVLITTNSSTIVNCPGDTTIVANVSGCRGVVNWQPPSLLCSEAMLTSNYDPDDTLDIGTTTIVYTSEDALGNKSNCLFNITILSDFQIDMIRSESPYCDDPESGIIQLAASGGGVPYSFNWNDSSYIINNPTFRYAVAGTNTVTASDVAGCKDSLEVALGEPLPLLLTQLDTTYLNGDLIVSPVMMGGNGNYSYRWSDGSTDSQLTISDDADGYFSLTVEDQKRCVARDSIYIFYIAPPDCSSNEIVVYPNPSPTGIFWFKHPECLDIQDLNVVNIVGDQFSFNMYDDMAGINLQNLASGTYFLKIQTTFGVVIKQVSITK